MAIHALLLADTPVRLWSLSSRERLNRILKKIDVDNRVEDPATVPPNDSVLLLRADYLYDGRLIQSLVKKPGSILQTTPPDAVVAVAAHVEAALAPAVQAFLLGNGTAADFPALTFETAQTLAPNYLKELRKIDPPYLLPITEENQVQLEKRLFSGSYKGVTDLVTKWVWPIPAQWATGYCAEKNITPNQVTTLSLLLVIAAGFLFHYGLFALGLIAAWGMTFLDTVDGKLARVTVNYSKFGNIYDHGIDLISPPFWYLIWGLSLPDSLPGTGPSLKLLFYLILIGYIGGRLCEGLFKKWLEPSGIFCWQPIDSYFRLITGRRNPNLILLTLSLFTGRPDLGLVAVAWWTMLSTLFLVTRLIMGFRHRQTVGELRSWFLDLDPETATPTLAQRCFSNIRR